LRRGARRATLSGVAREKLGRRLAAVLALAGAALFLGGCALFLFQSQTLGLLAMALGAGCGFAWQHQVDGEIAAGLRRRTRLLVSAGAALVVAGWVCFFAVWEELGLLLVVLGAVPLAVPLLSVRRRDLGSPLDGPPFGETQL
jgi:hypothetical protein